MDDARTPRRPYLMQLRILRYVLPPSSTDSASARSSRPGARSPRWQQPPQRPRRRGDRGRSQSQRARGLPPRLSSVHFATVESALEPVVETFLRDIEVMLDEVEIDASLMAPLRLSKRSATTTTRLRARSPCSSARHRTDLRDFHRRPAPLLLACRPARRLSASNRLARQHFDYREWTTCYFGPAATALVAPPARPRCGCGWRVPMARSRPRPPRPAPGACSPMRSACSAAKASDPRKQTRR